MSEQDLFERYPLHKKYFVKETSVPSKPGCWDVLEIEIFQRTHPQENDTAIKVGTYTRTYSSYGEETFYPFRQNGKEYALVSKSYTSAEVISLPDCKTVAEQEASEKGFCPVQFYVPEAEEEATDDDLEWYRNYSNPDISGMFGFVCGCYWGDDNSWKIRFVDLSQIEDGKLEVREGDFGYASVPREADLNANLFEMVFTPSKNSEYHSGCDYDVKVDVKVTKEFTFKLNKFNKE